MLNEENNSMQLKDYNVYFFFGLLALVSVVTFYIFKPFLMAIFIAAILAVVFQKPYNFFLKITKGREQLSAFATSFLGVIIFIILFFGIIGMVANEGVRLYQNMTISGNSYQTQLDHILKGLNDSKFARNIGASNIIDKATINKSVSQIGQNAFVIFQKTYQGIANFLFSAIIMFFTLYYFLIGGKKLVKDILYLSPLRDLHEKILIEKFISISRATLKGTLVVGIVQGTIGGILFWAVGVQSAIIWGILMVFFSFIPMFGSGLVWIPVAVIMFLLGHIWQAATIFAVGFGVISVIDNFIRPKLVGKDTQMHPLVVLFATIGGIGIFGFLGFIIGPIILALFITLWEIYGVEFGEQLKKYNS